MEKPWEAFVAENDKAALANMTPEALCERYHQWVYPVVVQKYKDDHPDIKDFDFSKIGALRCEITNDINEVSEYILCGVFSVVLRRDIHNKMMHDYGKQSFGIDMRVVESLITAEENSGRGANESILRAHYAKFNGIVDSAISWMVQWMQQERQTAFKARLAETSAKLNAKKEKGGAS